MDNIIKLPGIIIDSHCHGRDMEEDRKTTILQTLIEAKNGLIDITCFEPNTKPPITTVKTLLDYRSIIKKAKKFLGLKYEQYIWFGSTEKNLAECAKALNFPFVVGIKNYPTDQTGASVTTGSEIGVANDATILSIMKLCVSKKKPAKFHCDDPETVKQDGNTIFAEMLWLAKIIRLAKQVPGVKIIISHPSCYQSIEMILTAQNEGLLVAAEIMPHYLWFDKNGSNWNPLFNPVFYKCFNNLREESHRLFLRDFIFWNNPLIWIASDNAVHTLKEKIEKGLGGFPSNQEMVAVAITLASRKNIPDSRLSSLLCNNQANFLGLTIPKIPPVKYRLQRKTDSIQYNNGNIVNPWNGSKLYFPEKL